MVTEFGSANSDTVPERPPRVLYVTDAELAPGTAPCVHILAVCRGLVEAGLHVELVAPTPLSPPAAADLNVRWLRVPRTARSAFYQPILAMVLLRSMIGRPLDAVYVRHSHLLVVPSLICRLVKVPMLLEVNGRVVEEVLLVDSALGRFLARSGILRTIEKLNLRAAAQVVAVSEGISTYLIANYRLPAGRVSTVPNGMDAQLFVPAPRDGARRRLNLADEGILLCFVGALWRWQNVEAMVKAVAGIQARGHPCRMVVVGDGPERGDLEAVAARLGVTSSVTFTGLVDHASVPEYIHASDVCLYYPIASRGDGASPLKIYEYLAAGANVVAADLPGIRAEFGSSIHYAGPDGDAALADAVLAVVGRPASRPVEGAVVAGRSWTAVAARLAEILAEVTARFGA